MNLKIIEKQKPKILKGSVFNPCLSGVDFVEVHFGLDDNVDGQPEPKLIKLTRVEFKKFNYFAKYFKNQNQCERLDQLISQDVI